MHALEQKHERVLERLERLEKRDRPRLHMLERKLEVAEGRIERIMTMHFMTMD